MSLKAVRLHSSVLCLIGYALISLGCQSQTDSKSAGQSSDVGEPSFSDSYASERNGKTFYSQVVEASNAFLSQDLLNDPQRLIRRNARVDVKSATLQITDKNCDLGGGDESELIQEGQGVLNTFSRNQFHPDYTLNEILNNFSYFFSVIQFSFLSQSYTKFRLDLSKDTAYAQLQEFLIKHYPNAFGNSHSSFVPRKKLFRNNKDGETLKPCLAGNSPSTHYIKTLDTGTAYHYFNFIEFDASFMDSKGLTPNSINDIWIKNHNQSIADAVFFDYDNNASSSEVENFLKQFHAYLHVMIYTRGGDASQLKMAMEKSQCSVNNVAACRKLRDLFYLNFKSEDPNKDAILSIELAPL